MTDSLLVSLRSYRPKPGRDAREDFITEAFAWTLRTIPELGSAFLDTICQHAEVELSVTSTDAVWDTQVHLDEGIADMIAQQGSRTYLFEHKVYSEATAEQVDQYRRSIGSDDVITILITASLWNYTGSDDPSIQEPDVRLTWADVHRILDREATSLEERDRVDDFLALLNYEGIGPRDRLSESELRAFATSRDVIEEFYALIDAVRTQGDWSFAYEALPPLQEDPNQGERWTSRTRSGKNTKHGRIAFDLFKPWRPGILTGLIVDPGNIQTRLVNRKVGPDLAVYIGLPKRSLDDYRSIVSSEAFRGLCDHIQEFADEQWTVTARHSADPAANAYHPIILQQSLADVLRGTKTRKDQRDAVYKTLKDGVEVFVSSSDIQELREMLVERLGKA